MYKYEDQKEFRRALNGKMIVMLVGIMLIFNAITSPSGAVQLSTSSFIMASQAAAGDEEMVARLAEFGKTVAVMRMAGVVFALEAIIEIFAGVFSVKLSNRLDASKLCLKIVCGLLGAEVVIQAVLLIVGLWMPGMFFSSIVMPLMLLWGAISLRKLAKKYPDRKFAVEPNPARQKKAQPQKKNLMERAKAQVKDEEKVSGVIEEISAAEENK